MTIDEIMEMNVGRMMDLLIANLMGHNSLTTAMNVDGTLGYTPSYSSDMTAAWEVANRFGIAVIPQSKDDGFTWLACDLESVKYRGSEIVLVEREQSSISCDTAAEAICKAALIANRK